MVIVMVGSATEAIVKVGIVKVGIAGPMDTTGASAMALGIQGPTAIARSKPLTLPSPVTWSLHAMGTSGRIARIAATSIAPASATRAGRGMANIAGTIAAITSRVVAMAGARPTMGKVIETIAPG